MVFPFKKNKVKKLLSVVSCLWTCLFCSLSAQIDSTSLKGDTISVKSDTLGTISPKNSPDTTFNYLSPPRAALRSAIIPGWGQMYNKQVWKSPVFLGGVVFSASSALKFNQDYKKYYKAYTNRINPYTTDEYVGTYTEFELQDLKNDARKKYAWSMTALGLVYGFNVIDAFSSARIKKWNRPHPPTRAAYRSALIPGWGQIYNKKWWKVPIIYTGIGITTYTLIDNLEKHNDFREAYLNRENENYTYSDRTIRYAGNGDALLAGRQFYQRNVEVSALVMALVYLVNILDATVDAHLYNFNVDDNLELGISPTLQVDDLGQNRLGLAFNWRF